MPRTYYEIEVTARQLTGLLVLLALLLMVAFALGYGAAWSVLSGGAAPTPSAVAVAPTPVPETVVPTATAAPRPSPSVTVVPTRAPTVPPTPTSGPAVAPTSRPAAPTAASRDGFWVQVLAVRTESAVREAQGRLEQLGFPRDHQWIVSASAAGGDTLYKVRIGPFPDRDSADRVVRRMASSEFPDAWVVTP